MKSSFRSIFLLLVAYLSLTANAFPPRINLASGESKTKDHTLITRNGLLKTSIHFLRDNPQYLKNQELTYFLYDVLRELSEKPKAAKETIDTISSQIKFINAINEIQSANVEMDSSPANSTAAVHFDGEQFLLGSQRLIKLRQELITLLLKGDKLQHARNLAGNALHTLQDFYSRSNWIELGNTLPLNALAQPGSDIWQENVIAGATEPTCRNCLSDEQSNESTDKCANNLITGKLTSGYRSGQDIKKPVDKGKCSHGGQTDDSRLKPATGGINKDSSSKRESPHAR